MVNFDSDEDISASQSEPEIGYDVPTLPPPHASAVELRRALTSLQLDYAKCVAELKLVKKEKAELRSKLREKKKKSKKSASEAISGIPSTEIRVVAKKFCVMSELFLETSTSIRSFVKPMVNRADPDSGTRYASFASYEEGRAAEFFSALPEEQHDDVSGNDTYFQMFKAAFSAQRSSAVSQIRSNGSRLFAEYNLPDTLWSTDNGAGRLASPKLQSMLKFPNDKVQYPPLAPILYPNLKQSNAGLFRNPVLPQILRLTLYGPASLSSDRVVTATVGKIWGVEKVTPGAIAFAAVMVRYVLAPDTTIKYRGPESNIPWAEHYYLYKKMIVMAHGLPIMDTTIKWFNSIVFKGVANNLSNTDIPGQPGESDEIEAGIARALRGLTMGDVDNNDDEPAPRPRAIPTRASAAPRLPLGGAIPQRRVFSLPIPAPPSPTRSIPDEDDVQNYIQHQAMGSRQGFSQANNNTDNEEELEYGVPASLPPPARYQERGHGRGRRGTQKSAQISGGLEDAVQSSTRRSSRKR
ncbi:hypothetical protein BDN71DRAFT_1559946 [Pleurotus eryngii]|uniref:Uncharacterized protein n=1 Tax=Pleurotus eryngii TaxID=5323 RepID=A0A9P5ZWW1_PLEER|nr:hypothetical protein BDN71DRAFT_1559946 [Pleurotus eryngii]